jgi:predicted site-specific integrase-resolvase
MPSVTDSRTKRINAIRQLVKKHSSVTVYDVSPRTIENWMNSGMLPFFKPSYGIVRFDLEACDKALGRFERNSSASDNLK